MEHLLHIWPTVQSIADDIGAKYQTVAGWKTRRVPPARFAELINAARRRGFLLTFEHLTGELTAAPQPIPVPREDAA
ncbi:MAG: hypothetical protein EP318_15535 [Rhodobacteraceae bacterium]|nr:MAG: hypothetical protein EP318_15535 [Paracoccaceae bacterium]